MSERIVYVTQHIAGTQAGNPKINIIGAQKYGEFKFLLPEFSQMIFSPGPLIGVACSIVSDITNGKYNLLKWDKQERKYYPIKINLYEKGEIDDN
jgi:hypothetical protein